ncbi:hypothetical protein BDF21DRAFT_412212 [Thamnidium elegans]|nr:hypothetical protein BDF21DRAFT_412212 [Thamnidium elegans]
MSSGEESFFKRVAPRKKYPTMIRQGNFIFILIRLNTYPPPLFFITHEKKCSNLSFYFSIIKRIHTLKEKKKGSCKGSFLFFFFWFIISCNSSLPKQYIIMLHSFFSTKGVRSFSLGAIKKKGIKGKRERERERERRK